MFYSFSFLFFFDYGEIFGNSHRVPAALRFKLQALRYFAKFRREISTSVFPVKIRLVGLALTGFGLVCRTLRWQNAIPKKKKENKRKKPENKYKKKVPLPQKFVQFLGFFFSFF